MQKYLKYLEELVAWDNCFVHAIFSIGGYVFFAIAGLGGTMHLYLQKHESPDKTGKYFELANQFRYRMNCIDLVIGFALSIIGFTLGAFQARSIWGSFITDSKTIFSAIVLTYYAVIIGVIVKPYFEKVEAPKRAISVMAIIGVALILISVILVTFLLPTMHRYL